MKKFASFLMVMVLGCGFLMAGMDVISQAKPEANPHLEKATFAGGCFWCMQPAFDRLPGVVKTVVGYTGGWKKNPTYEEVSAGNTGHYESIDISFNPKLISYEQIIDMFWQNIDPTQSDGQFVDIGPQYRTVIFYHSPEQKKKAEQSKEKLAQSGRFKDPIVTSILPAGEFYPAENHHQKCYLMNPIRYSSYHAGSGRDSFFERIWGSHPKK